MNRWIVRTLKLVVTAALLGWAWHEASQHDLAEIAKSIDVWWVVAAWGVHMLLTVPVCLRWRLVAGKLGVALPFWPAWRLLMIGHFFNQTLPSSLGGDAVRIWMLSRTYGKPLNESATSIIGDRILALVTVPLFALAGLMLVPEFFVDAHAAWVLWPMMAAIVITTMVFSRADLIPTWEGLRRLEAYRQVLKASAGLRAVFRDPLTGGLGVAMSVGIHMGVGVSAWMLSRSVGSELGMIPFVTMTPIVLLIALAPVTISGWGLRESAMVVTFGVLGAEEGRMFATSVLLGLVMIGVGLPGGVIWILEKAGARPSPQAASDNVSSTSTTSSSGT